MARRRRSVKRTGRRGAPVSRGSVGERTGGGRSRRDVLVSLVSRARRSMRGNDDAVMRNQADTQTSILSFSLVAWPRACRRDFIHKAIHAVSDR